MAADAWLAFVAASALVLLVPGPTILSVISYSLAHGRQATKPLVAAVALGDSTALLCSLLGLGGLLTASTSLFGVVRWAGGLCLMYLGLKMLATGVRAPLLEEAAGRESARTLFMKMYAVSALNPKGIVFYAVFVPQFIDPAADLAPQLGTVAATFVTLATANATLYAMFASRARAFLTSTNARRGLNVLGGTLLSCAGVWALFARRMS
jgi:threonine/homoserine/homoserine lactone efflux protein